MTTQTTSGARRPSEQSPIERNFIKLQRIFRFTRFKPEMFYAIRVDAWDILLQGRPSDICDLSHLNCGQWSEDSRGKYNISIVAL